MRSAREIRFRLAQQIANIGLFVFPPARSKTSQIGNLPLPDGSKVAASLAGTPFAQEVERIADSILAHRFPILGISINTGQSIEWRRDYVHNRTTGASYFRFIPYLSFEEAGDHKNIWELSRHQHLVLLAQAHLFTGRGAYVDEIVRQLQSWWQQNPFLKGINWASALEVAFRALSWLWLDHLIGPKLPLPVRESLWDSLHRHGLYLEHNLSTYFSPNTHLLGEGLALYALGLKFPSGRWRALGERIVREELGRQIHPDGSYFEQSTYYHVYALDFLLFYYLLAGRPEDLRATLRRMAGFLAAVSGPGAELPFFGDDDGGRLFHPYGERSGFARSSLTTCAVLFPEDGLPVYPGESSVQAAWWLRLPNEPAPRSSDGATELFPHAGIAVISRPNLHIVIDAGPFGPGGAGHSHSDTLSFTVQHRLREILIDPGTYTYVADPKLRDAFRGSAAHNTIRVDGLDQADPVKPFRWENKPAVQVRQWLTGADFAYLDAECRYRGFTHRRRFLMAGDSALFIVDEILGPPGDHLIEQFWHPGEPVSALSPNSIEIASSTIFFSAPASLVIQQGWRSRAFAEKSEAPVVSLSWRGPLPAICATALVFEGPQPRTDLTLDSQADCVCLTLPGFLSARFPPAGMPTFDRL